MCVIGAEHVPRAGPCVVTFNHYYRPGFNAWYMALALAAVVPVEMHFVMTGELTFPGKWYAPPGMAVSKWLLARIGKTYGFTTMPPMPPRKKDIEARADAVRKALAFVRRNRNAILGLAPEGGDSPDGCLARPASGSGRFALLLAGLGLRVIPLGVYEEAGEFCLRFGPIYELRVPPGLSSDDRDHAAANILMKHIAGLLPERLRGEFA